MPHEKLPLLKIAEDKEKYEKFYEELIKKIKNLVQNEDVFRATVLDIISNPENYSNPPSSNGIKIIQTLINSKELAEYDEILKEKRSDLIDLFLTEYMKIFKEYSERKDEEEVIRNHHIGYSSQTLSPRRKKTSKNKYYGAGLYLRKSHPDKDER